MLLQFTLFPGTRSPLMFLFTFIPYSLISSEFIPFRIIRTS
uniref:Uncharacterized protein n=1 Tax=Cryptosporidium parvum TaxID=5807 RepID=F0X4Q6_CRYPV